MTDAEFAGALRAAVEAFPAHSPDLVARGVARGRRNRRWRRIRVSAAACAAALALVGGYVTLSGTMGAASGNAARWTDAPGPVLGAPVTADDMVKTLTGLLPEGARVTGSSGTGTDPGLWPEEGRTFELMNPSAKVRYTDAGGASAVHVTASRPDPGSFEARLTGCGMAEVPSGVVLLGTLQQDDCRSTTLPDGTVVTSFTAPVPDSGQVMWSVLADRPDTARVRVDAYGGGDPYETREAVDPLPTLGQLTAIATSTRWDRALASVRLPEDRPLAVLAELLPPGARIVEREHFAVWARITIADEQGTTRVSAGVSDSPTGKPLGGACAQPGLIHCSVETSPNGDVIRFTEFQVGNAPPGVVTRMVTVERPDGVRIQIDAGNSGSSVTGPWPGRPEPALDFDQLRTIALSPRWTP